MRTIGRVLLVGIGGSVVCLILAILGMAGERVIFVALVTLGACALTAEAIALLHLRFDRSLSAQDRRRWFQMFSFGAFAFVAAFYYLLRRDRRLQPRSNQVISPLRRDAPWPWRRR
jgi:hypothetical protein